MFDCAIIGTGAAGISAALTLKALNKNFVLIGNENLSVKIRNAERIKNYPGLAAVSGGQMKDAFFNQLKGEGIEITAKQVTGVYDMGDSFGVLCGQDVIEARTVILASGVETVKPVKGELEFLGKGVSYCVVCDGFLYKGKTIAVVCTAKELEHEVEYLCTLAGKVYVVPLYKDAKISADNAEVVNGVPLSIVGGQRVEKILFKDREIEVDGVFMLKNSVAPSALVAGLKTDGGHVEVDRACATNIKGLYAAGDCTGRPYQYAKAVGEGNVAAYSVNEFLVKLEKR